MKKTFLIIFILVLGCAVSMAARPETFQEKAKKEIFKSLQKYGTNVMDKGEDVISFRYEDMICRLFVQELNPTTLYLSIVVQFSLSDSYNNYLSYMAANSAAANKPVCVYVGEGVLVFSCEMYAKEVKPFISVLPDMLVALYSSSINFGEEYEKQVEMLGDSVVESSDLEEITDTPINIVDKAANVEKFSIAGNRLSTTYHYWECVGIELYPDKTILKKRVFPKQPGTYINSYSKEYIEDANSGKRYYIVSSSIGMDNTDRRYSYDRNPIEFTEVYPALPKGVKLINIWSGSDYYIKRLQIE